MRRQRRLLYRSWWPVMGAYAGTRTKCLPTGYRLGGVLWGEAHVDGRGPPPLSAAMRLRPGTKNRGAPCARVPSLFMAKGGALIVGGTEPRIAARGDDHPHRPSHRRRRARAPAPRTAPPRRGRPVAAGRPRPGAAPTGLLFRRGGQNGNARRQITRPPARAGTRRPAAAVRAPSQACAPRR